MTCTRCKNPATAHMAYDYGDRQIWIEDLTEDTLPGTGYALCESHGTRMTPPVGWLLSDLRSRDRPLFLTLEVA